MNNIDFIYSLLKYYGKYKKVHIKKLYIENNIKQTIYNLRKEQKNINLLRMRIVIPKTRKEQLKNLRYYIHLLKEVKIY